MTHKILCLLTRTSNLPAPRVGRGIAGIDSS